MVYGSGAGEAQSNILRVPVKVVAEKKAVPISRGRLIGILAGFIAALSVLFLRLSTDLPHWPQKRLDGKRVYPYTIPHNLTRLSFTRTREKLNP